MGESQGRRLADQGLSAGVRARRAGRTRTSRLEPVYSRVDLDRRIEQSLWIPFGRRRAPPIIGSRPLSEDGLVALYNSCDAIVLPTRAEGWSLPIPEAMACELPVIVTAYSAPLDYLDSDLAYLIDIKRQVPIRDRYLPGRTRARNLGGA